METLERTITEIYVADLNKTYELVDGVWLEVINAYED